MSIFGFTDNAVEPTAQQTGLNGNGIIVNFQYPAHVPRKDENDSFAEGFTGQTCSCPARVNGNLFFGSVLDNGNNVFCISGTNDAHGSGLQDASVGCIELLRNFIATDISFD